MKTTRPLLAGVFLISAGALALEVVLTRIFSVTMWYHFAFMAISMALMGSATAGVFIYFFPQLSKPGTAQMWIGRASVALAKVTLATMSGDARMQYETARRFVDQAEGALTARNYMFAAYLADKAEALAKGLIGR